MLWTDFSDQRPQHIRHHLLMQPMQHEMVIVDLFGHRYTIILDGYPYHRMRRPIIHFAAQPGRERRATPDNLPHQAPNMDLPLAFPNDGADRGNSNIGHFTRFGVDHLGGLLTERSL